MCGNIEYIDMNALCERYRQEKENLDSFEKQFSYAIKERETKKEMVGKIKDEMKKRIREGESIPRGANLEAKKSFKTKYDLEMLKELLPTGYTAFLETKTVEEFDAKKFDQALMKGMIPVELEQIKSYDIYSITIQEKGQSTK